MPSLGRTPAQSGVNGVSFIIFSLSESGSPTFPPGSRELSVDDLDADVLDLARLDPDFDIVEHLRSGLTKTEGDFAVLVFHEERFLRVPPAHQDLPAVLLVDDQAFA